MIEFIYALFDDKRMLAMICAALAAGATVITVGDLNRSPTMNLPDFDHRSVGCGT